MPAAQDRDRAFFGHPIGLSTLFFTEMWERFCYYGMRALLVLYMVGKLEDGGLGMSDASAGVVMALYTASVYLLSLPGGWIADRFLGQRRGVVAGGIGIALGNLLLAVPIESLFYPGLGMIALGTGLLKPNVSTLVGQLYSAHDTRRDAGFTIYYMGINIGAWFGPIVCGFLAQSETFRGWLAGAGLDPQLCWHFMFGAAALGMTLGIVQFLVGWKRLGDAGLRPTIPEDPKEAARDRVVLGAVIGALVAIVGLFVVLDLAGISVSKDLIGNVFGIGLLLGAIALFYGLVKGARNHDERRRVIAMIPLFIGGIAFFAVFEQASTTLSLFAERFVHREYLGISVPASYWQSVNSTFVVVLATVFAWMWIRLARANREPSSVMKFSIGMILTAVSFAVLLPTIDNITNIQNVFVFAKLPYFEPALDEAVSPLRVSPNFLITLYFFSTTAELCISPVGLSSMSKLAPSRMAGMVMGTWFLATAIGNYLAGRAAGFSAERGYDFLFYTLIIGSLVAAAALFLVAPVIKRMMAGSEHASAPADKSEKTEPEPLPKARVVKDD
ncbi:MAG: Di-/tripeptide transporter [Deltaproteobacteria bacterium]|nr:Di-/tripeptide transporter [Deltaproteobacteria bacterium]